MPDAHDKLGWALELASRSFMIHPLPIDGKAPDLGYSWKNVRTTDPARIKAWFADNPNMNYGVSPGSGGVIIDLDQGKTKLDGRVTDGINKFLSIESEQPEQITTQTFTVVSPSQGIHLYLLTKEPVTNYNGFGLDIDVRGEGGYVVGPGCYYDGMEKPGDIPGYYDVVHDLPFKQAPAWVVQRCRAHILNDGPKTDLVELDLPSSISQGKAFLQKRLPAVEGMVGTGDNHTFVTAAALCHNYALSQATALELMANYRFRLPTDPDGYEGSWNDRCEPPWDVYGGGNETLETKVRNADNYGKTRRGEMSGALMLQGLTPEIVAAAEAAAIQVVEESDGLRRRLADHLLRGQNIFDRIKPVRWVVPYWLPYTGITGIVAESGTGKSTVMLDLALSLAHDIKWQDTLTRTGITVIYTCGEDYEGSVSQMRAWCKAKKISHPNPDRFVFMPEVPPLAAIDEVNVWIDVFKEKVGKKDVAVFIDTWQRATCGFSQNEEREMQSAINTAEAIGRAMGGPVVVAFHSPKKDRGTISGWEGQRNTSNALWYIEKDPRGFKLETRKVRGAPTSNFIVLDYVEHETGLVDDYFGFPIKHVVPKRIGGTRINADGGVHVEDTMGATRRAVAKALCMMEDKRADDTNAVKCYSIPQAAERIVGHPGKASFNRKSLIHDTESEWAREIVRILTEEGGLKLSDMSHTQMMEVVAGVVMNGGYTFEDGKLIFLDATGPMSRITVLAQGGLTDI